MSETVKTFHQDYYNTLKQLRLEIQEGQQTDWDLFWARTAAVVTAANEIANESLRRYRQALERGERMVRDQKLPRFSIGGKGETVRRFKDGKRKVAIHFDAEEQIVGVTIVLGQRRLAISTEPRSLNAEQTARMKEMQISPHGTKEDEGLRYEMQFMADTHPRRMVVRTEEASVWLDPLLCYCSEKQRDFKPSPVPGYDFQVVIKNTKGFDFAWGEEGFWFLDKQDPPRQEKLGPTKFPNIDMAVIPQAVLEAVKSFSFRPNP